MQQYHRRIYTIPPKDYENSCVFQAHVSVRPDYLRMLEPEQFITQDKMQKQLRGSDSALNRLVKMKNKAILLNVFFVIKLFFLQLHYTYIRRHMRLGLLASMKLHGSSWVLIHGEPFLGPGGGGVSSRGGCLRGKHRLHMLTAGCPLYVVLVTCVAAKDERRRHTRLCRLSAQEHLLGLLCTLQILRISHNLCPIL